MDPVTKKRQAWAVKACDAHQKAYKTTIPPRVRKFWQDGEGFAKDGWTLKVKVPGWSEPSLTLRVAPPSWSALEDAGLDDAVVGPKGDWKHARSFLPLFTAVDTGGFIVAELTEPYAVGWFEEEAWETTTKGYRHGVYLVAESIDALLAQLQKATPPAEGEDDESHDDGEADDLWADADE